MLPRLTPAPLASLPGPPTTLPLWGKVLWYLAETVATGAAWQQFDYGQEIRGLGQAPTDPDPHTWRRVQAVFGNNVSAERADDQIFTLDIVNFTNGQIDSTWDSNDWSNVNNAIDAFINSTRTHFASWLTYIELRGYVRAFNSYQLSKPFADSGPPEAIFPKNFPLTGVGGGAPQGCTTISELTAVRRHWGRVYLPTLAGGEYNNSSGRLIPMSLDAIANAWSVMNVALNSHNFAVVVPTTQSDKQPVRALQQVSGWKIDDVGDVIRRRRYRSPVYTNTFPANP